MSTSTDRYFQKLESYLYNSGYSNFGSKKDAVKFILKKADMSSLFQKEKRL